MEYIKAYFLSIITVIIFTVIIEILMPNSSFRKYIKLVLGLLVIIVMINPITNLKDVSVSTFEGSDEIIMLAKEYENVQENQINEVFCEKLEKQISDDILQKYSENIKISVEANYEELTCVYISNASVHAKNDIRNYIINTYKPKNVVING